MGPSGHENATVLLFKRTGLVRSFCWVSPKWSPGGASISALLCPLRPRDQGSLPTGTSVALPRSPKSSRQVCLNSQGSHVDSPHCFCGYGGHRQRQPADLCLLSASRKHQSRGPHHSLPETGLWPTSQNFVMFPARIHSIAPEAPASFPPHGVDS